MHAVFPQIPRIHTIVVEGDNGGVAAAADIIIGSVNFNSIVNVEPSTPNTPGPIPGAPWVQQPSKNISMPTPGVLRYTGSSPAIVIATAYLSLVSIPNEIGVNELGISVAKNGVYISDAEAEITLGDLSATKDLSTTVSVSLVTGDELELFFVNIGTSNPFAAVGAGLSVVGHAILPV